MNITTLEFNELIEKWRRDPIKEEVDIYIRTIQKKVEYIIFLEEQLSNLSIPTGFTEKMGLTKLNIEIYLEALVQNLNSLPDVLAQLIVVVVLKPLISSVKEDYSSVNIRVPTGRDINPNNVIQKLKALESVLTSSCPTYSGYATLIKEIEDSFISLLNSHEFKYINDLVNTIKHRHLIESGFNYKKTQGTVEENDWKFLPFDKDNTPYPEVTVTTLLSEYKSQVWELSNIVCNKISHYVSAEEIVNPK